MAANMTETRVEETTVIETSEGRARGETSKKAGFVGAITIVAALLLAGAAMYDRHSSHRALTHGNGVAQTRSLESNTTDLPDAVMPQLACAYIPNIAFPLYDEFGHPFGTSAKELTGGAANSQGCLVAAPYMEDFTPPTGQNR